MTSHSKLQSCKGIYVKAPIRCLFTSSFSQDGTLHALPSSVRLNSLSRLNYSLSLALLLIIFEQ